MMYKFCVHYLFLVLITIPTISSLSHSVFFCTGMLLSILSFFSPPGAASQLTYSFTQWPLGARKRRFLI